MIIIPACRYVPVATLVVAVSLAVGQTAPISEAAVLAQASKPYEKAAWREGSGGVILGTLNNVEVVVDYICSDICPDYTVRIIHLRVEPGADCVAAGGVEKSVIVPMGIGAGPKFFCFPKILTDNWDAYLR